MLSYKQDTSTQVATARFGHLEDGNLLRAAMPAFAPTPRMRYEARAVLRLIRAGAEVPVIIIPLSTRRDISAELATVLPDSRQRKLIEEETPLPPRLVLPDIESEALACACDARRGFLDGALKPPKAAKALLESGLKANPEKGRLETGAAWSKVDAQYGLSTIGGWFERLESQAKSQVFVSPTPIIRAQAGSAERAFEFGWRVSDSIQETAFQGRGIQLLIHSEVFLDNPEAEIERNALQENLRALHQSRNPRNNPVIAAKVLDGPHFLTQGPQRSVARGNLKETLCQASDHVRRSDGVFVVLNYGSWTLSALDSGVDIVGARGTGDLLEIDSHFGLKLPTPKGRPAALRRAPRSPGRKKTIQVKPFDPIRLCDASEKDLAAFWKEHGEIPVAPHVQSVEWARLDTNQKREYRAMQVFGSLLDIAALFRDGAKSSTPLRDSVHDRIGRMKNQDEMFELSPSLEGLG